MKYIRTININYDDLSFFILLILEFDVIPHSITLRSGVKSVKGVMGLSKILFLELRIRLNFVFIPAINDYPI